MCQTKILFIISVTAVIVLFNETDGRAPFGSLSRQKRISDQRLAELETLIALSRMKNKMVTIPVGFGRVDPLKIGRRKRSMDEFIKSLLSDIASDEENEEEIDNGDNENRQRNEPENLLNEMVYDDRRKIARYRHLPVRLPD